MPHRLQGLDLLTDTALEGVFFCLQLQDLASLSATSRALRALVAQQPDSVWRAVAASDPAYPRHV